MSIPRPTRGMMVELHGGHKDGQRVPFQGQRLRVPVMRPVRLFSEVEALDQRALPRVESYTLRQSQPDGHWFYVLD
jgi:hypothetical protein